MSSPSDCHVFIGQGRVSNAESGQGADTVKNRSYLGTTLAGSHTTEY